jgi:hypothetical protein
MRPGSRRGFDPRRDLENWLEAERQVDAGLVGADSGPKEKAARPTDASP